MGRWLATRQYRASSCLPLNQTLPQSLVAGCQIARRNEAHYPVVCRYGHSLCLLLGQIAGLLHATCLLCTLTKLCSTHGAGKAPVESEQKQCKHVPGLIQVNNGDAIHSTEFALPIVFRQKRKKSDMMCLSGFLAPGTRLMPEQNSINNKAN